MEYNLGFWIAQKNSNHTDPQEAREVEDGGDEDLLPNNDINAINLDSF